MWPLDQQAHEVLKLPGETSTPWAVFDCVWYLHSYPEVAAIVGDDDPRAVLTHYLRQGQTQGHSPNQLFDEQWHRLRYPRIVDRIVAGHCKSAFDAYCRRGALDRSAHWLFDELAYRDRYPDLTDEAIAGFEMFNGYDHYLRHGSKEGRVGHVLFDPELYLAQFDPAEAAEISRHSAFQHYLDRIDSDEPEPRTSVYFDPAWYLTRYPDVARCIQAKRWKSALHHYLCNDTPTAFDPSDSFSEAWYLRRDPGLLKAIESGSFRNGYMHFLRFGANELRSPAASIDLEWYVMQEIVRSDLEHGRAPDAYTHWLMIGEQAGLAPAKPQPDRSPEARARHSFHGTDEALLPIAGRFGYSFECDGKPAITVVLVVRNGFAATMATIASLHSNTASDIELIIVDRGSNDETLSISQYVPGAVVIRFESDIGWSRGAEAGRRLASAGAVLFLSDEARIAPGSLDRASLRLANDPSVGAVGGMILQGHGIVAQAGGIVWRDGRTEDYGRGCSALEPEVNFVRDVDFCAPAFLLARAGLLSRLEGFDHECATSHQAVDLCLRIAQAGSRVVYDPSVMITVSDAPHMIGDPGDHFLLEHAELLAERFAPGDAVQVFARHAGVKPPRVLFIEDTVPLRRIGSGFVRANDLVQAIASLGYGVTVFPISGCNHPLSRVFGDMPEQAEVMHNLSLDHLAGFLEARPGYYDIVWVARTHNLAKVRPILARSTAEDLLKTRVVLDTEAVTPYREAMEAELAGQPYDLEGAMQAIQADTAICQHVVAVTSAEADTLRSRGIADVSVIGHMIETAPTALPFAQRAGLLFVGAIHQDNSPNLDSLVWFTETVLPLIEAELTWETQLTIAGYLAPGVDLSRFAQNPRIRLLGLVTDLDSIYNTHRVFIAPTRYAAGAPYKVLEAASRGVPVVVTEVLRCQLDWRSGQEIIAAKAEDPAAFAACVLALYRDETLWHTVREGALHRLRQDNGRDHFTTAVASALAPARSTGMQPTPK